MGRDHHGRWLFRGSPRDGSGEVGQVSAAADVLKDHEGMQILGPGSNPGLSTRSTTHLQALSSGEVGVKVHTTSKGGIREA